MSSLVPVLGPIVCGVFASIFAYGIMVVQCHFYFQWYKNDQNYIKIVVVVLLILDSVGVALNIAGVYNYVVSNFDNISGVANANYGIISYPILTGITAFIVQCFFGRRIRILTGSLVVSIIIYIFSSVQLLAAIGTTIAGSLIHLLDKFDSTKAISLVWLSGSLLTDLLIAVSLIICLQNSRTGQDRLDNIISRLIRLTVQTGVLTTSFALAVIIAFVVSPGNTAHIAFGIPLSKVYTNSLLSSLNARRRLNAPSDSGANDGFDVLSGREAKRKSQVDAVSALQFTSVVVNSPQTTNSFGRDIELQNSGDYEVRVVLSNDHQSF